MQGHLSIAFRFFTIDKTYVFSYNPFRTVADLLYNYCNGATDWAKVSIPTKLQTDSTGFTLESVIHIGCYPPLLLL